MPAAADLLSNRRDDAGRPRYRVNEVLHAMLTCRRCHDYCLLPLRLFRLFRIFQANRRPTRRVRPALERDGDVLGFNLYPTALAT